MNWKEYEKERVSKIYLIWHGYKNQPTGFGIQRIYTTYKDALDYIKRDPNIGVEKNFNLSDQYAITIEDIVEIKPQEAQDD